MYLIYLVPEVTVSATGRGWWWSSEEKWKEEERKPKQQQQPQLVGKAVLVATDSPSNPIAGCG